MGCLPSETPCRPVQQSTMVSKETTKEDPSTVQFNAFVRGALINKTKGDTRAYDLMVDTLGKRLDPAAAARWFNGLRNSVSLFQYNGAHKVLLSKVLAFDWQTTESTLNAYGQFLVDLVVCNPSLLKEVLVVLVRRFLIHAQEPAEPLQAGEASNVLTEKSNGSDAGCISADDVERIHDGAHRVLHAILRTIPSASTALFPVIVRRFPYRTDSIERHLVFIKNLLRLSEYSPDLLERLLEIIVHRLLLIDVELRDSDFVNDDIEGSKQSPAADKLDRCLELLFCYIELVHNSSASLCDAVFQALVHVFDSSIVPTYRSRHTQFLVFFICSFKNAYAEVLVKRLMERAFDVSENNPIRVSCALYAASFLSQASTVRHATRMYCFESLLRWIHSYIEIHAEESLSSSVGPDEAEQHLVFYSLAQALLDVFGRWKEEFAELLDENPELVEFLNFPAILDSTLNPLRFCSPSVVQRFASTAAELSVADCFKVLSHNVGRAPPAGRARTTDHFPFQQCNLAHVRKVLGSVVHHH